MCINFLSRQLTDLFELVLSLILWGFQILAYQLQIKITVLSQYALLFSCLIAWASNSEKGEHMLRNGDSGHSCRVLDLNENASCASPLTKVLALGLTDVHTQMAC